LRSIGLRKTKQTLQRIKYHSDSERSIPLILQNVNNKRASLR